jgi:RNA polymerase sigma-70 factor (ECF subfamily)
VRRAQAGDAAALRRLLERLAVPMYRFGRHFCRNPDDAQDVMQESLAALVRTLPRWRGDAAPSTWAYVVARNTCGRMRRRKAGAPARLESLARGAGRADALRVAAPGADPAREFERGELGEALGRALAALPVSQREVVVLRDVEGLSASEVGKVLGLGEDAVKSRLHRGRTALRRTLASLHGDVAPARRRGCPDTALLLSRHLEGEVDAATCRRLAKHVEECADCGAACDGLRSALGACARLGGGLPAEAREAVRRAARAIAPG